MDEKQKRIVERLREDVAKERRTSRIMTTIAIVLTILAVVCFLIEFLIPLGFLFGFPAGFIWWMIYKCRGSVERLENELHIAETDMKKYEQIQNVRGINAQVALRQAEAKNAAEHPKCPMCGSYNTKRISTMERSASVAAVGLASSKIGKQYECKDCKHKW